MDRLLGLEPEVVPGRISLQLWDDFLGSNDGKKTAVPMFVLSLSTENVTSNDPSDTPLEWLMPMLFPLILAQIKKSAPYLADPI